MKRLLLICSSVIFAFSILLPQTVSAVGWSLNKKVIVDEFTTSSVLFASKDPDELPVIPAQGQQKKLRGDADGNGKVNYMDAMLVLRHSVGLEALSDDAIARCDVDGKDGLSYMDAMLILRYSVGLITKL